ncbi:TPA: replicative DNA helicase [Bacillus pacificus]|uniref:replicative DNA helicase n=1 Tax=Bacillus cereus group TaxID=86661 RepID=UPI00080768F7|nr:MULTISPECIES: replicative DNA helicase [Bacillus cereus group]MCX3302902.1 replicative DNA helicase [Bacillus pacificus]MCX3329438.1 replicative DNA helicase [Bacillus pacificus]MDA2035502.1 replicative DNA helicase [Bacillus cereus group sp. Bcc02]MDF9489760.1 replicative DNA helicase [Bacillus cereus]OBZ59127.1 DNA helicase [Bacillus cereus]
MNHTLDYEGLYSIQAEQGLLGGLILDPDKIKDINLQPEQMYRPQHVHIFRTMLEIDSGNEPVDFVTMTARLAEKGLIEDVGGIGYLAQLSESTPSTSNIKYYEKIVWSKWRDREVVRNTEALKQAVHSGNDTELAIQTQMAALLNLSREDKNSDGRIKDGLIEVFGELENPVRGLAGMDTGFTELNRMTAGFKPQELIIVAARPSVGKTAFCLNVGSNAAGEQGEGDVVAIFSLEMGQKELLKRMVSINGNIDGNRMKTGELNPEDWTKLTQAMGVLNNKNIRIFDDAGITTNFIWSKVKKLCDEFPGRQIMVIIDYLQLITGNPVHKGNRQAEIAEISRTLKTMARQLNVCVVALSQLSRGVEQRQDKRPMMSDLRESGQIEQDADVIAFLYREDYYDRETENKNTIEIIVGKQRNGPVGSVELAFIKEYGKFVNLERRFEQ